MIKKLIYKILLFLLGLVALNYIYKYTLFEKDLLKYSDIIELIRAVPDSTEILYVGESSNTSTFKTDQDRRPISAFVGDYFPNKVVSDITKPASHAGNYFVYLQNLPKDSDLETVIVTLNLRSFNAQWIYSDLETALQKSMVLLRPYPPLVNRFMLSFKDYDIKTDDERATQFKEKWDRDILRFPYQFPYKTVAEWDYYQAQKGILNEDGSRNQELTELSCHYIKAYGFQIDTNNHIRLKDFDKIIELAKKRHWNLVFNLMAENYQKAEQLVGSDLVFLMEENRKKLIQYFKDRDVPVVDNLYAVDDELFTDQNWTTEHYHEKGRKTVAKNVAESLKVFYPKEYYDAKLVKEIPTKYFNDCESELYWGQEQTFTTEKAYSGKHSSKFGGGQDFSLTLEIPTSQIPEKKFLNIDFQIYRTELSENTKLVIELSGAHYEYTWNGYSINQLTQKTNQWENVHYSFALPADIKDADVLKVYLYQPDSSLVYLDDFGVEFR